MGADGEIVVAGAGIGGLTCALALARRGFSITLVERAEALSEAGAGIQLSPNAARVLIALGLDDEIDKAAVRPERLTVRSGPSGRLLVAMPLGQAMEARFGAPYWVIHRADLQQALSDAVRAERRVTLELGRQVTGFRTDAGIVRVASDGGEIVARALIGADGMRSAVRAALGGPAPAFSGYVAWRGTLAAADAPAGIDRAATGLWLGPDAHLVHYPLRGGRLVNVVAIVSAPEIAAGWGEAAPAAELAPRYARWAAPARALIDAVPDWLRWPLATAAPLARWNDGPVALLGDAAHPSLPFLAQGGAMAIEDAAVLADCLAATPHDASGALARYAARRRPRTTRLQRAAAANGRIFHLAGAARLARDVALSLMPSGLFARRQAWIYGWRP